VTGSTADSQVAVSCPVALPDGPEDCPRRVGDDDPGRSVRLVHENVEPIACTCRKAQRACIQVVDPEAWPPNRVSANGVRIRPPGPPAASSVHLFCSSILRRGVSWCLTKSPGRSAACVILGFAPVHCGRYRWKPLLFSLRLTHYGRSTGISRRRTQPSILRVDK
jgi:hypothetical protein